MNTDQAQVIGEQLRRGSLEMFQSLPPVGREYFRQLYAAHMARQGGGDQAAYEALIGVDYARIPPTPEAFLNLSDYCGHVEIWPIWREHFLSVCAQNSATHEVISTGAMGMGKTFWAMLVLAYKISRIWHLRDPATFYGLQARSKIVFGLYALTKALTKEVGFYDLRDVIIDQSPFFRDVAKREPHGKEHIRWPHKGIEVIVGSTALHAVGKNLFAVVADELNYYHQGEKTAERARDLVGEVSRRLESRFVDFGGGIPGVAIFLSQTRTTSDFLEQRIRDKSSTEGVKIIRGPRWNFSPKGYKRLAERSRTNPRMLETPTVVRTPCGPVPGFRVYAGDEVQDPRILDRVERRDDGTFLIEPAMPDSPDPSGVIVTPPVIHYRAYNDDLHGALRAISDIPSGSFTPFFARKEVVVHGFTTDLIFPFSSQELPCYEGMSMRLQDAFTHELVTRVHMGRRIPIRHPEQPRYIHLDLSQGGDRTGFVMLHPSAHYHDARPDPEDEEGAKVGEREVVKDLEVDFYVALKGGINGEPIDYSKVRVFINWLRDIGFWIRFSNADQYMSFDHLQRLRDAGFLAEVVSVDRTSKPYRDLRQAMNERRVAMPYPTGVNPDRFGSPEEALTKVILFNELTGLEHDVKRDKVDHRKQNPDGSKGSKDVGDGLAGAAFKCLTDDVRPGDNPTQESYRVKQQAKLNRYLQTAPF